ncbi:hypothetical protein ACFX2H_012190 [Malus domestica]
MVFNVVIVSPHGYFGQANVLGLPDTGGQVVYILDQVRAMESEMLLRIQNQGLDVIPEILNVTRLIPDAKGTTCSRRLEGVSGTEYTHILRVPFRTENEILRKWISRFVVWPYLETFAEDASNEIATELQRVPDLIIGNYSDGNLVATLCCRINWESHSAILLMHWRKQNTQILIYFIELFTGLMFLIPSLISSPQEQICVYTFHILTRKKGLLLYMGQIEELLGHL